MAPVTDRSGRQALYNTRRWRRLRAQQLALAPLCGRCEARGVTTAATVADHIKPHGGDPARFYDPGNLQSLCGTCHNADKQREERGSRARVAFDATGLPLDPTHHWSASR